MGRYQIKQVISVNVPGRVSENIKVGALSPHLPTPSKVNLGLLTAKGSPNPPAKPLSGLAAMRACVSAGMLSPQANALPSRWPDTRGLWEVAVFGRVTRENSGGYLPSWSCICFGSSSHSIPSPDAAFVTVLPKRCHKQQLSSFFQHCNRG